MGKSRIKKRHISRSGFHGFRQTDLLTKRGENKEILLNFSYIKEQGDIIKNASMGI